MAARSCRAARALAHLPEADPGLAALALWCETADGSARHTCSTQDTIRIGTGFPDLPLREQIGVLGHHVLHVALRHEARALSMQARLGAAFDATVFNLCADAVINSCLIAADHAVPRPAVTLSDVVSLTSQDPTAKEPGLSDWDVEMLYIAVMQTSHGGRKNAEDYMQNKQFKRDLIPASPSQATDRKSAEWQAHLKRAASSARGAGRGLGSVLARLSKVAESTTPWEVYLRGVLARAVLPDPRRTYKRPRAAWIAADTQARRTNQPHPAFEPGVERRRHQPRIVIGVDTSGSVQRETLQLFAAEILGIASRSNAEIHLLCFDDSVYDSQKITLTQTRNALEQIDFRRDGGTSYDDLFAQAEALDPSVLVVLTDLAAPLPLAPRVPVIWAAHGLPATPPAYGKLVDIRG